MRQINTLKNHPNNDRKCVRQAGLIIRSDSEAKENYAITELYDLVKKLSRRIGVTIDLKIFPSHIREINIEE